MLVAGGLGERLGYGGIKVSLPVNITTDMCYLQLYCEQIKKLQNASNMLAGEDKVVPLVIMTSDDTHSATVELLEKNNNFGMREGQVWS